MRSYSDLERELAVAAWVTKGTFTGASEITGIPWETIRDWRKNATAWWEEKAAEIRQSFEEEHRAAIREIIVHGLEQLQDRVQNGDHVVNKDGLLTRRPMIGRDLVIATGTMIDKLRLSLGQPTSIAGKAAEGLQDKLESLKKAARDKAIETGEVVELGAAVHQCSPGKSSETGESIAA